MFQTPTSVLLDTDGDFIAFGWEAESKYNEIVSNKGKGSCELYRHFKMILHYGQVYNDPGNSMLLKGSYTAIRKYTTKMFS